MGYRPRRRGGHQGHAPFLKSAITRIILPLLLVSAATFAVGSFSPASLSSAVWWLTNAEPPAVMVAAPQSPLRGQVRFAVRLEPADRASVVGASVDGQALTAAESLVVDTATLPDGPHRLVVTAADHSRQRNTSQQVVTFETDNTVPRLDVQVTPGGPAEGRTTVVRVQLSEPARLAGRLSARELPWQGGEREWWAVVGVPPAPLEPALDLRLTAEDVAGNVGRWERQLAIQPTRFPTEVLAMPPQLVGLITPEVREREMARLRAIFSQGDGPARWRGRFIMPADGPLTTEFGTERTFVGGYPGEQHPGLDVATPLGARVVAPADARVAFVGTLELRGNTVVLDHGAGVFTTYGHLAEAQVRQGDLVQQGQRIGLAGSTGFSTGPHLHWELWVGDANVDPLEWTGRDIP